MRLSEFKVWKSIVEWIDEHGGKVIAGCPPGSSVYDYRKFCIVDPISGKRDEPDILFIWNEDIYIVECKSTLAGIKSKSQKVNSNENDIEKLQRIELWLNQGRYDRQLCDNFGIVLNDYKHIKIGIGYAALSTQNVTPIVGVVQLVVHEDYQIKIVSE